MLTQETAASVIDHALVLGANFVELFVERNQVASISTLSSQVQSIESGIDFGIGIRVVYGTKVLYGYTNRTEADELKRIASELAAKDSREAVHALRSFEHRPVNDIHGATRTLSADSEVADKVRYLLAADKVARAASNMISQTRGSCLQREQAVEIFNSDGLHTADTRHYVRAALTAIASNGTEQATGSKNDGALTGWEIVEVIDPEATGEEAARQALVNLSAKPCPSGRMPVVIGNGFGGVIFHEACGHLLETTSVAKKASVFHDQLGEMIANPVVNAVDDGTMSTEWGSINIDDEGMATQKTQLIENGRLVNFLADRIGAEQTGYARTGSGRRQSYKFAPASRMRNTFIEPGDATTRYDCVDRSRYLCIPHGRRIRAARHRRVQLRRHGGLLRRGRQSAVPRQSSDADQHRPGRTEADLDGRQRFCSRAGDVRISIGRGTDDRRPADVEGR